jgi:3-oxoacyl-[acyl-carrier protein] reductase
VNNAGIVFDKEFEERTVEDWKRTLDVNLIWSFIMAKLVGKIMKEQQSWTIINIASTNGIENGGYPTSIDYDASKAGIISLTKNLAIQFAPIRVNAVAPGWINTDMNKDIPFEFIQKEADSILLKRFWEPEEVAKVIRFLASDDASYINGETIIVNWWYC